MWVGRLFYIPAFAGGIFGLLGGYMTDRFGRRRVLTYSILIYALAAFVVRVRHLDRDAALPALPGVHRRVRRVRRGRGVAGRALPRTEAAREGARLYAGVLVARRPDGGNGQQLLRGTCGGAAGARCVRFGSHPESPRAVALHADVRRHPGHPADPHPPVPARIAGLAAAQGGGHAAPPEHRRAVRAGAASHDDRHDGDVRHGLRCGVRRHSADPADRARPAGSEGDGRQSAAAAGTADGAGRRRVRDQVPGDRRPGRTGRAGVARGRDRQPAQADSHIPGARSDPDADCLRVGGAHRSGRCSTR